MMTKCFLVSVMVTVLMIGLFLRQGEAHEVTIYESIELDGTKIETLYLSDPSEEELLTKGGFFNYKAIVRDPFISPQIKLAVGEKMIIRIDASSSFSSFYFIPDENKNLSTLKGTRVRDGLCNGEPWHAGTWHYYKYWTAVAPGTDELVFDSSFNKAIDAGDAYNVSYSLALKVPVTVGQ